MSMTATLITALPPGKARSWLAGLEWSAKAAARRYGRAWAYARGRLSEDDADTMRYECAMIAGSYTLASFDRATVLDQCRERFGDMPELPALVEAACRRVYSKWSGDGESANAAEEWAMDLVQEYASQDGIVLTDLDADPIETEEADHGTRCTR